MKFVCSSVDLIDAVLKVVKAVSSKSVNPILECIKLCAKGDYLTLSATDLEISIEKKINAEVMLEGEILVPGKYFADFIGKINDENVEFTLKEDNRLKIKYLSSEGFIQTLNAEDFPIIEIGTEDNYLELKQGDLRDLVTKTIFSAATDDIRPILKGCYLETEGDSVVGVCVDGYRLAVCKKPIVSKKEELSLIVPTRALAEISRFMEKDEEQIVRLVLNKKTLAVEISNTLIVSRLIEGNFINYKGMISAESNTDIVINKKNLENAIDRAGVLIRADKVTTIKFDINDNNLNLTANSEIGNIDENINIQTTGKDIKIAFNSKYVLDCLKAVDDEFIKIKFNNSSSPCIIKGIENDSYLYLILPIRVA